ncbi:MAG: MBL fold metallo-hydrolase [Oscillospiraceae bacterium]|nr:MBL fold metallo-hydrolase [Oscillospiraceae bacterium]
MNNLKWEIGDVQVFQIVELEAGEIIQSIINEAIPENIRRIDFVYPNFADEHGNLKALVQAFLIKVGDEYILVDTCNGNAKKRTDMPEWSNLDIDFLEQLYDLGIKETDIDYVICTHLHTDHVGWNTIFKDGKWVATFPNAKYIFAKEEYDYWKSKPENEIDDDKSAFDDSVEPIMNQGLGMLVGSNYRLNDNISLIPTVGHTPGHISVIIESNNEAAIITGDLLHHPCQIAYPNWNTEADGIKKEATISREKLLNEISNKNIMLIGSHFSNPVAGYVQKENDIFKFVTKSGE